MSRASLPTACRHYLSRVLTPLTVACCAYLAAQGVGRLAVAQLRFPARAGEAELQEASFAQPLPDAAHQTEAIVQRNIFCADCLPAAEAISGAGVGPAPGEVISGTQLFATVIPEGAASSAFAALQPSGSGSWRVVAAGDELHPGVQVLLVTSTGIVLERDGQQQAIALAGAPVNPSLPPTDRASSARSARALQPAAERRALDLWPSPRP